MKVMSLGKYSRMSPDDCKNWMGRLGEHGENWLGEWAKQGRSEWVKWVKQGT